MILAYISAKHEYLKDYIKSGVQVMHLCENSGVFVLIIVVIFDSYFEDINCFR